MQISFDRTSCGLDGPLSFLTEAQELRASRPPNITLRPCFQCARDGGPPRARRVRQANVGASTRDEDAEQQYCRGMEGETEAFRGVGMHRYRCARILCWLPRCTHLWKRFDGKSFPMSRFLAHE